MKKLLATLCGSLLVLVAGAGVASAAQKEDPNGDKNHHGLCTAYFNGQKVGHDGGEGESGEYPKPFEDLEDNTARPYTDDDGKDNDYDGDVDEPGENTSLTDAENLFNYCENSGAESLIGGSPEHGRFNCINQDPTTHLDPTDEDYTEPVVPDGIQDPADPTGDENPSDPECTRNPKPGEGDPQAGKNR